MTRLNGFIDYIGGLGGFTSEGHYSGVAQTQMSLLSSGCSVIGASGLLTLHSDQSSILVSPSGRFDVSAGNAINLLAGSDVIVNVSGPGQVEVNTAESYIHLNAAEDVRFTSQFDVVSSANDDHNMSSGRDYLASANRIILLDNSQSALSDGISGISRTRITMQASGLVTLDATNGDIQFNASGDLNANVLGEMNYQITNDMTINCQNGAVLVQSAANGIEITGNDLDLVGSESVDIEASAPGRGVDISVGFAGSGPINLVNRAPEGIISAYAYGIELATELGASDNGGVLSGISTGNTFLHSSGLMDIRSFNGNMNVLSSGTMTIGGWGGSWVISNNGKTVLFQSGAGGTYSVIPGGNLLFSAGGTAIYAGGSSTTLTTAAGNTIVTSQAGNTTITTAGGDTSVGSTVGQLTLNPWNASGQLRYEFGPYESWHTSPSHTASFFPIPHSGQIKEMFVGTSGVSVFQQDEKVVISGVGQYASYTNVSDQGTINSSTFQNIRLSQVLRQDVFFSNSGGLPQVHKTGWYRISYHMNIDQTAGGTRSSTVARIYNNTDDEALSGLYSYAYNRDLANGEDTATATAIVSLRSGDILLPQVARLAGGATMTVRPNSNITLEYLGTM